MQLKTAAATLAPAAWAHQRRVLVVAATALLAERRADPGEDAVRLRLQKQVDHLFTFLDHPDADATNNPAERQLRAEVIARKISCGNKTHDGADAWQVLWYVTLPLLRPVTALVIVLSLIDAMKVFGQPWFMTNGGPAGASTTVVYDLYLNFQSLHMGYASAIGFCLLVIILALTGLRYLVVREEIV
jgi:hypothetical protein